MQVEKDGEVLAASDRAVALEETGLPTLLPAARGRADGPPRAERDHLALPVQGRRHVLLAFPAAKDAFWVYEAPSEEDALPIAKMLAPWPGRVEVKVDAG